MSQSRTTHDCGTKPCRCEESRPETISQRGRFRGLCYECTKESLGGKRTEKHHPFGRDNPAVANIAVDNTPGNWHRALDHRRAQRPEVLKRPGDNPLHRIAAVVATLGEGADAVADFSRRQGWPDWVAELSVRFAEGARAAADWLLILAGKLDEHLGPEWWVQRVDRPQWHL